MMTSVSGASAALTLLSQTAAKRAQLGVVGFLTAPNVTVGSPTALQALIQAFPSPDLAGSYAVRLAATLTNPAVGMDNAKHVAVVETILANRDRFPPEGFSIRTELGDGASIESRIPPLGS